MHDSVHHGPTVGAQALRALARHPGRIAFVEGDRRTTYAAALDLVARMQAVYAAQGLGRGDRIAILTANRSESWCAGVAAQSCAMSITWLHPLGSLD
ncbi:MAG TPA: acyl-CoA synthetase, partial [Rhodoblastus sp.]|nr:acyl-CoA synthetase [Rhodoblastus sp.]